MKKFIKKKSFYSISIFMLYFLILAVIALYTQVVPAEANPFSATLEQIEKVWGLRDPASLARGALILASDGIRKFNHYPGLHYWPPGFMILEGIIAKLFGLKAPIILILQLVATILFSFFMWLSYHLLKEWAHRTLAFLTPLILFAFSMPRFYLLQANGVVVGTSFAIGFFFIAIIFAFYSIWKKRLYYAIYAGIFMALAAYFRPQFDLFLYVLTYWGILNVLMLLFFGPLRRHFSPAQIIITAKIVVIVIITFYLLTVPWRIVNLATRHHWDWVQTPALTFQIAVTPTDVLKHKHSAYIIEGAGNLTCQIDPTTCGNIRHGKKLTIETFFKHMPTWYALKFKALPPYWFSYKGALGRATPHNKNHLSDYIANSLFLITLIGAIVLIFTRAIKESLFFLPLIWLHGGIFLAHLGIFTIVHFEVRYFYFIKIYGLILFLFEAILLRYLSRTSNTDRLSVDI